jgi:hypothetical protein
MAAVVQLITDGTGPIYYACANNDLREQVAACVTALRPHIE